MGLIPGSEDPLEKEMTTHSSILASEILWIEKPGRLQSMGLQELDTTSWLNHQVNRKIEIKILVSWKTNKSLANLFKVNKGRKQK